MQSPIGTLLLADTIISLFIPLFIFIIFINLYLQKTGIVVLSA